jgi:hypothetical protein
MDVGARARPPGEPPSLFERVAALGRPIGRRHVLIVVAGALVIAAASLALPSTPTYDPWSWIAWGREIVHGALNTNTGPSWKPLPVMFTTIFGLFGGAAPDLWLMVARAGALLALVMVFRLSVRLTPGRPALLAGLFAIVALVTSQEFVRGSAMGNSEGLLVALVLFAIERHLDGRRRQAFVLLFAAGLLRPEVWPFLLVYGCWLVWRERAAWKLVGGLFVALPVLWLGPELWGSGHLFRAAERAAHPNPNSPAFAKHPSVALFENWRPALFAPAKVGAILGFAVGVVIAVRERRMNVWLWLSLAAALWMGLVAVMTEGGFSGNQRYLVVATGVVCVLAATGWGWLVSAAGALAVRLGHPRRATAAMLGALFLVLVLFAPFTYRRAQALHKVEIALHYQAIVRGRLKSNIAALGGPGAVRACGHPYTTPLQVPAVAWYLDIPGVDVGLHPQAPGTYFRVRRRHRGLSGRRSPPDFAPVASVRPWGVTAHCAPGTRVLTKIP